MTVARVAGRGYQPPKEVDVWAVICPTCHGSASVSIPYAIGERMSVIRRIETGRAGKRVCTRILSKLVPFLSA